MTSSASSHMGRVSGGLMPKPSISLRVPDRPVPNSRRPLDRMSTVAAASAARTGWLYGKGKRRTPWPMRMFSVRAAMAP